MEVGLNPQDYNCPKCLPSQQKERGCSEDSPIPKRWQIGNDAYRRCPAKLVTAFTQHCIELHSHYKNGFLLQSGGIIDQPVKYLQIMRIIENEISNQRDG